VAEEIERLKRKFTETDPLTNEKITNDQRFTLLIVVYHKDTPKDEIPDVYLPDDQKGKQGKGGQSQDAEPEIPERD
jgi:hypothetical protein